MMMSNSIQIYSGEGASPICVQAWKRELNEVMDGRKYKIEEFTASYDAGLDRGNVAMVIIPGGNSNDMHLAIKKLANKINREVGAKASFLGSCAGVICTSPYIQKLDGEIGDMYTKCNFNPLTFNGLYYMPHSARTDDKENISAIEVEWLPSKSHFNSQTCKLYHAFGPAFPIDQISEKIKNNCRVLFKYKTESDRYLVHNSAATVLYQPHNSTPRLVTGVHPEIGIEDITSQAFAKRFDKPNHPHIRKLAAELDSSEQIRKEICRSWFSDLNIELKNS